VNSEATIALPDAGFTDEAFGMTRTVDIFFSLRYIANKDTDERAKRYAQFTAKESEVWSDLSSVYWPQQQFKPLESPSIPPSPQPFVPSRPDIASTTQNSDYRNSVVEMGKRVVAGCGERLAENELKATAPARNAGVLPGDLVTPRRARCQSLTRFLL
jgi:hypothetical protein